jgi:hypothetical protein
MTQNRKTFGMTTSQIGILAGLAGLVCLLFGVAGWLVFGGGFKLPFSQNSANTLAPQFTPTPFSIPTITPTGTPTPIPYEQLIPNGWTQHQTALVELWLPPGFENAGPNEVSVISGSSVVLEMALTGTASSSSIYKLFAMVAFEPLTADSLDTFLDARLENIPVDVNMVERRKVFINSTEAYRLTFEGQSNNVEMNDLLFIFLDGSTVWYVKYSAQINEFYEMLPTFEESVLTFRIVR